MAYPFKGCNRVTQAYGGSHGGIDVVGSDDDSVLAVCDGTVDLVLHWDGKSLSGSQSYGNLVRTKCADGTRIYYAHLKRAGVERGDFLRVGDYIGIMGSTGKSTGPHLHLEARKGLSSSTRINPCTICSLVNERGCCYSKSDTPAFSSPSLEYYTGKKIALKGTNLFVSSVAQRPSAIKSGTFYIYSDKPVKGRLRITSKPEYVGKKPTGSYVTGWISESDAI